jgi:hypothetical protein
MRWSFAVLAVVVVVGADETMERVMRMERMVGMMRTMFWMVWDGVDGGWCVGRREKGEGKGRCLGNTVDSLSLSFFSLIGWATARPTRTKGANKANSPDRSGTTRREMADPPSPSPTRSLYVREEQGTRR